MKKKIPSDRSSTWKQKQLETNSLHLNKELNDGVGENQLLNREAAALY